MHRRLRLLLATVLLVLVPAPVVLADEPDQPPPVEVAMSGPVTSTPGEPGVATLRATREGEPVPGLTVEFVWRSLGPSPESGTSTTVTDETGTARLEFPFVGQTTVMASVRDAAGEHVATVTMTTGWVCRCTPPFPRLDARGRDARNGDDRVRVETSLPAGSVVDLFRIAPDGKRADRIRRSRVDERGRRAWRVTDHNGRRATGYFVVARPTETSASERTSVLRIR
jgi:hypothetical protein